MGRRATAVLLSWLLLGATEAQEHKFPPVALSKDNASFGAHLQRTMALLATSTPEKHHKVRILFYGQSITEQEWSKSVADDLGRRFPNADLEIENRALGGFASQILVRVAEHDVIPFYPDLVIFHVYGANEPYEEIIRNIRTRTTAEVLMQRDHVTKWPLPNPSEEKDKDLWWDHMMNDVFLPDYAKKYGCALADIRGPWLDYLKSHKLEPKALLKDEVHLNDHGNFLMAELVKRYLAYKPALLTDEEKNVVRTFKVGQEVNWQGNKLVLPFEGNRVDLIGGKSVRGGASGTQEVTRILIDGKRPSEWPCHYVIPRVSNSQAGFWPAILRVGHDRPLEVEDWTLTITECNDAVDDFKFEVEGSRTGPDGSGTNKQKFVSHSGRVVIEPEDWWVTNARAWVGAKMPDHFKIRWTVKLLSRDEWTPPAVPDSSREATTTVAQGLTNQKHTLELTGPASIEAIRIYRPPVKP